MTGGHIPDRDTSRVALFIAIIAGFMTPFDLSAVNIALPAIGSQFSMDAVSLSWVSTAYLLASAVFLVPFGRIADIHGRKKIFTIGLAIFTLTSLALVFSPTSLALIILRFVQGAGAALIFGTAVAILTLGLQAVILPPVLKFLAVAALAIPLCFIIAHLIRSVPGAQRIL